LACHPSSLHPAKASVRRFCFGEILMQLGTHDPLGLETTSASITTSRATKKATNSLSKPILRTPDELANIVSQFASSDGWLDRVQLRADRRWYERLHHSPDYDIWVISWMPEQSTGFHDHGASSGAFIVATGILEEHRPGDQIGLIHSGKPCAFGPDYAHDVRNVSLAPAISVHAYSPPLDEMNEYELEGSHLIPREVPRARASEDFNQAATLNQE
jgi:mannose-6-phosphate isomerase-like protein (cupin superfamily)